MAEAKDRPVRIQTDDFSVEEEVLRLREGSLRVGAVVTFLGTARDFSEGRSIRAIEFEQYSGMALREMTRLKEDALKRFAIIDVRIVHRVSRIAPGGQIVLIAVSAEHRKAAFEACLWCIDTLKKTVPLWKKETTEEGESWVVPHP
ncbi:MAG: molybdenum cofactor biosynthesis protein MoaE [Deltaproteobacteria bacterium]|nr:molybdenum cofactor biosynthesis protein MoaE [Deltaproteobacteria bacterium]